MPHRTDTAAIATTVTAPAWVPALSHVNVALTFISLVAGLAFLAWRWWRAAKGGAVE